MNISPERMVFTRPLSPTRSVLLDLYSPVRVTRVKSPLEMSLSIINKLGQVKRLLTSDLLYFISNKNIIGAKLERDQLVQECDPLSAAPEANNLPVSKTFKSLNVRNNPLVVIDGDSKLCLRIHQKAICKKEDLSEISRLWGG